MKENYNLKKRTVFEDNCFEVLRRRRKFFKSLLNSFGGLNSVGSIEGVVGSADP